MDWPTAAVWIAFALALMAIPTTYITTHNSK